MDQLNYQHLFYFFTIMREGGVAAAARHMRLSHSTLSAQLRLLEERLGGALFERGGRRLVPTPLGTQVAGYAEDIFRLGSELVDVARGKSSGVPPVLRIGVLGTLPRTIVHRLVAPALSTDPNTPLYVRQDSQSRLLEDLAAGRLHVVLSDTPAAPSAVGLHAHVLGESETFLYGVPKLVAAHGRPFPEALSGAPVLLPTTGTLRRAIERWFADRGLTIRVAGEMDDAGLLRTFGGHGLGLFAVRGALRTEVEETFGAKCIGKLDGVRERYYALSVERRIRHRGVAAIVETARAELTDSPAQVKEPKGKKTRRRPEKAGV